MNPTTQKSLSQNNIPHAHTPMPQMHCRRNLMGQYGLYIKTTDGKTIRIPQLAQSVKPFEFIATVPNTPIVAVRQYIRTPNGVTPQMVLINTENGATTEHTPPQHPDEYFIQLLIALMMGHEIVDAPLLPSILSGITAQTPGITINVITPKIRRRRRRAIAHARRKLRPMRKKLRTPVTRPAISARITAPYALRMRTRLTYGRPQINTRNIRNIPHNRTQMHMLQLAAQRMQKTDR